MTSKRTFGLVGDYGGDSSDEEDKNGSVPGPGDDKVVENNSEHGYLVQKTPKLDTAANSNTRSSKVEAPAVIRSKWDGVRTEYDDSSLMYKFTQVCVGVNNLVEIVLVPCLTHSAGTF